MQTTVFFIGGDFNYQTGLDSVQNVWEPAFLYDDIDPSNFNWYEYNYDSAYQPATIAGAINATSGNVLLMGVSYGGGQAIDELPSLTQKVQNVILFDPVIPNSDGSGQLASTNPPTQFVVPLENVDDAVDFNRAPESPFNSNYIYSEQIAPTTGQEDIGFSSNAGHAAGELTPNIATYGVKHVAQLGDPDTYLYVDEALDGQYIDNYSPPS